MSEFYTNVSCVGNNILYRGIKNGRRVKMKIPYSPKLYIPCKKKTEYKTLHGEYLEEMSFTSIYEMRDFVKRYSDVEGFRFFGNTRMEYAFIADNFPEDNIDWDISSIYIANIDIETTSDNGFPNFNNPIEQITAITVKSSLDGKYYVFSCGNYTKHIDQVVYYKCKDEYELIEKFLKFWESSAPDIVTGWNIKIFDIPYLVARFNYLLGSETANRLSPWGKLKERQITLYGKEQMTYSIMGIGCLDYYELYRRFAKDGNSRESYRLDYICHIELNKRKLSYAEYGNLRNLYKQNYQKFIEYNIRDVELVNELDEKLKLIELGLTLAYVSKVNYEDINTQVTMWDSIIFNNLKSKNIMVPQKKGSVKDTQYTGAYVKDPRVGMFDYVASFDLASLYPHLIQQYSISPENIVEREYIIERKKQLQNELKIRKGISNVS